MKQHNKIAIMGAMREEIEPLLELFGEYKLTKYAKNEYCELEYNGTQIVIAYSKIGKVFATLTATTLIEKFGCNMLLFSGVAGAINPALNIGDLIIADKLCQHDVDITAFGHPHGFIPESQTFTHSSPTLNQLATDVARELSMPIQSGTIATGDQFIASQESKEFIQSTYQADAIEMEGAAVAVVCDALDVPFLILRAISDTANMDAGFDFDEFLQSSAKNSANFMLKIVNEMTKTKPYL